MTGRAAPPGAHCPATVRQHGPVQEIQIRPVSLEGLAALLAPGRLERLLEEAARSREALAGRTVWNISSTASGGGVAEMLQTLLAYGRGVGVDTRWLVMTGDPPFFRLTKRLHNLLHGNPGDGAGIGPADRDHYRDVVRRNLDGLQGTIRPGDVVLVHDPQPAGMVAGLQAVGAKVVWRCHIGSDEHTAETELGWSFLRDLAGGADGFVFSRRAFVPDWVAADRLAVIPPSLDPLSTKNRLLDDEDVATTLGHAGLVRGLRGDGATSFPRRDGTTGITRTHEGLFAAGEAPPHDARLVLQVSRWDRLKDMRGVLDAFATHLGTLPADAQLMLVGPDVGGVTDDPEGAEVLEECRARWLELPEAARSRIQLCCLPMDDPDENAHLVNALQRYATVVVQKSLAEGFGLTVTEPMWKGRPVVASAVGGIQDQIEDGVSGVLLRNPRDREGLVAEVGWLLEHPDEARRIGETARERVRDRYLGDRHLRQYGELFGRLATDGAAGEEGM